MVNNVLRDMRSHLRKAGITLRAPLTIHALRKSFAQNHANNGTPSVTLKMLMGHASITTTEKYYLQISDDNTLAAVKRYENLLHPCDGRVTATYAIGVGKASAGRL